MLIRRTKITLLLLQLTGMLVLLVTGWVAAKLSEIKPKPDEERGQLAELRNVFLGIGETVRTKSVNLRTDLPNLRQSRNPAAIEQLEQENQEWREWLNRQKQPVRVTEAEPADPGWPQPTLSNLSVDQLAPVRQELISLLDRVAETSSNYYFAARYLCINGGQPLIGDRLTNHEQMARSAVVNLVEAAGAASQRAKNIEAVISDRARRSEELKARIQSLRFGLVLAVTASALLLLLRWHRHRHAETSEAIRRHAEQQAKLDRLAYFSSQLAQEHAHEIKQPLTAINAHLYTLQKTLIAGTPAHKDAAVIRSEIKRLDQIVEKFLQQARPAESQPETLTAELVLGEIRDLMTAQLKQQAIELRCEMECGLGFRADSCQLKQVLINLVKNAAESILREGVITLRAKPGNLQLNGKAQAVTVLEVEDTGGGISPEIQERIFDPFFSTKERGSGLGLAISARIIEQHGGRLEFDTRLGEGTIFRIMLPAKKTKPTQRFVALSPQVPPSPRLPGEPGEGGLGGEGQK